MASMLSQLKKSSIRQIFYIPAEIKIVFLSSIERASRKSQKDFSSTGYHIKARLYVELELIAHLENHWK